MNEHDVKVTVAIVIAVVAFFIAVAAITIGSFVTNTAAQKACIEASGSWTTSAGMTGKSCIITK
jgi:hypothetical protein